MLFVTLSTVIEITLFLYLCLNVHDDVYVPLESCIWVAPFLGQISSNVLVSEIIETWHCEARVQTVQDMDFASAINGHIVAFAQCWLDDVLKNLCVVSQKHESETLALQALICLLENRTDMSFLQRFSLWHQFSECSGSVDTLISGDPAISSSRWRKDSKNSVQRQLSWSISVKLEIHYLKGIQ